MKILHTADWHLGSAIDSVFPREVARDRKNELRKAFNSMVEYADRQNVSVIMLCGDVFDKETPLKRDKDFFLSVVKSFPHVDFLYLRGNHDKTESFEEDKPENLITFSDEWSSIRYGNVVISGIEITQKNNEKYPYLLNLKEEDINIVMLHGQVSDSLDGEVVLSRLRDKNIDYLALGHVHKPQERTLDERANYCYCGSPVGRGFDEYGERGFRVLEIEDKVKSQFVLSDATPINLFTVDVSGATDEYEAYKIIKESVKLEKAGGIVKIELVGEIGFDADGIESQLEKMLANSFTFVYVKNSASLKFDIDDLQKDLSLKGEFLREVLSLETLSKEQKDAVISMGLKALQGKELDL